MGTNLISYLQFRWNPTFQFTEILPRYLFRGDNYSALIPWGQRVYLEHSGILGTEPAGRPTPLWGSSRHGLPNTRQIRSKASPLTRTMVLINTHQSKAYRCGSLSSKERVSKRMRALFTLCWIISPPPIQKTTLQANYKVCLLRCNFTCTSYGRVTFSLSLSKNCM